MEKANKMRFQLQHTIFLNRFKKLGLCTLFMLSTTVLSAQNLDNLKDKKPFNAGGSIALNTSYFATNGNNFPFGVTDPFQWNIVGTPWISLYDFMIPFSFTIGKQNQSLEHPFYQFGMSPTYKWITLHLGYSNMTFSPYTLSNHTFLGAGVELNPKKFRFAAMYGRLQQAASLDTTARIYQEAKYKRMGFGVKVGYGKESNFFDLTFFKAKDELNSIQKPPSEYGITPAENVVIGATTKQKINELLEWYADIGYSLYTRDLTAPGAFYDDEPALNAANSLLQVNMSTHANMAFKTGVSYTLKNFRMGAEYERVAPEYLTLGSYFFANDFQKILVTPSLSFAKRKANISATYNLQWNNLEDTRLQTTYRSNGTINLALNPNNNMGLNLGYTNFYIFQKSGTLPLNDSVAINMMTHVVTAAPRLTFTSSELIQNYVFTANFQTLQDQNIATNPYTKSQTLNLMVNGIFNLIKKKKSFVTGINFLSLKTAYTTNTRIGFNGGYNFKLLKDKLDVRANANISINQNKNGYAGHTEAITAQLNYSLAKAHSISCNVSFLNNGYSAGNSYFEFRGQLSYVYSFAGMKKK